MRAHSHSSIPANVMVYSAVRMISILCREKVPLYVEGWFHSVGLCGGVSVCVFPWVGEQDRSSSTARALGTLT